MAPRKKASRKIEYWAPSDLQTLRKQAGKIPLARLARLLKRTELAVQRKAQKASISLRLR